MKPMLYDPVACSPNVRQAVSQLGVDFPIRAIRKNEKPTVTLLIAGNGPHFSRDGNVTHISGGTLPQLLRAISLVRGFRELPGKLPDTFTEKQAFDTIGLMFDCSRNGVLRVETVKYLLRRLALMGFNLFMLYTEDTYEVPGRPYFGYLRGRYTQDELAELDTYAHNLGIEMIPCIQTLGHLAQPLQWQAFNDVRDTADVLLVDEPKTYEFIEQMVDAATAPFRSKRIHVGMDEAHSIGNGKYKQRFGDKPAFDIMISHLDKVMPILRKRGLKPMMWSDMWFRLASPTGGYGEPDVSVPAEIAAKIPRDMQQVYWDYYKPDVSSYKRVMEHHRALGSEPVFAGGVWSYPVLWTNYDRSFHYTRAAMKACREAGMREVFTTVWGDDGCENDMLSTLPALQQFAEEAFNPGSPDEAIARSFAGSTGATLKSWQLGAKLDWLPSGATMRQIRETFNMPMTAEMKPLLDLDANMEVCNPAKYLLWQDPLLGLYDADVRGSDAGKHYGKLAKQLERAIARNDVDGQRLTHALHIARVLELKAELGVRLYDAYHAEDRKALTALAKDTLPELIRRAETLRKGHRAVWMSVFKPQGWEVLDLRYGGVIARLQTARDRLKQYLSGKVHALEELAEPRLPITDWPKGTLCYVGSYRRAALATVCG